MASVKWIVSENSLTLELLVIHTEKFFRLSLLDFPTMTFREAKLRFNAGKYPLASYLSSPILSFPVALV